MVSQPILYLPRQGLQSLEFGRGLILGYIIKSRNNVDELLTDHTNLAKAYNRLRFAVSQSLDSVEPEHRDQLLSPK
jgi:hypothetical protein